MVYQGAMKIRSRETRSRAMDSTYSKGRHYNVNITGAGRTVTDLIIKPRENNKSLFNNKYVTVVIYQITREV